tara:strand:- start:2815 stop:4395 length:1581 start_codon:yes stop_codon:yes gene_type:complete
MEGLMPFNIIPVDYDDLPTGYQQLFVDGMRRPYVVSEPHVDEYTGNLKCGFITLPNGSKYWIDATADGLIVKHFDDEAYVDSDPVMQRFGRTELDYLSADRRLYAWIQSEITQPYTVLTDQETEDKCYRGQIRPYDRLIAHVPQRSKEYKGKISLYQTNKARDQDKRIAMKPGRAIKYMFPELSDHAIEKLVDQFRHKFSEKVFTLHTSTEAIDFKSAYSHTQSEMENPETTWERKSLCCSCMRYEFDNLEAHPAEAYASGEFTIVYLKDSLNRIAGRCVVWTKPKTPQAGPIYGTCESSMDKIQEHLESIGAEQDNSTWEGARMKRIVHHHGGFVAPYLDLEPRNLTDDGHNLVIDCCGEIDASRYDGTLDSHYCTCASCAEGVSEDEYYYSDSTDECYCHECYHESHSYCDYLEEYYHNDDAVRVWGMNKWGVDYELVSECNATDSGDYILCSDSKFWCVDDAQWCETESEYISPEQIDNYFTSDGDSELYHKDDMVAHPQNKDEYISSYELEELKEKELECTV